MARIINLISYRFGKLVVIKQIESDYHNNSQWLCKCDCGNEKIVRALNLKNGNTKSCGCLHKERKDCWTKEEIEFLKTNYPIYGPKFCISKLNKTFSSVTQKACIFNLKVQSRKRITRKLNNGKILCKCKHHGIVEHYNYIKRSPVCCLCNKQRSMDYAKTPKGRLYKNKFSKKRKLNPINNFAIKLRSRIGSGLSRVSINNNTKIKGCFRNLDYTPVELYNYLNNIQKLQNNLCPICCDDYSNCVMTIEHVIPLAKAKTEQEVIDLFDLKNLNLMCKNCNSSKCDSNYNDWIESKNK